MKKDVTMKKSSFMKGAFITTFGIVLAKLLGAFYVIPFHALIGDVGGALYGYAYTIYTFFISLASAGIPLAISKLVSEYQALGYHSVKLRVFKIGKRIALLMGLVCFLFVFLTAPFLAKMILGNVHGGNSINDVIFVTRVIGTAILIVPVLGIYRGYFEGHRFMSPPSISQVLEQLVRVLVILIGTYLALKVFNISMTNAIGIALFGATVGAFASYIYLVDKKIRNKSKFQERIRPVNEPLVTNKMILQKIILYSLPFIFIDLFKSLYNFVDMVTVVKGLVKLAHYKAVDAEIVYSSLSTWASKFNIMLVSISSGIIISLIPNLTDSMVKKKDKNINNQITQAISMLLFFVIPMTLGISFLAKPIWNLFYGDSLYGPSVLSYYIFVGLFVSLFTAMITILQTLKDYRAVFVSLIAGSLIKIIFNSSLIGVFYQLSFPPYYGVITASILGYLKSIIICFIYLVFKYRIHFDLVLRNVIDIICGSLLMIFILFILHYIVPFNDNDRLMSLMIILVYVVVGVVTYIIYAYKTHTLSHIFGSNYSKYLPKFKKNKKGLYNPFYLCYFFFIFFSE